MSDAKPLVITWILSLSFLLHNVVLSQLQSIPLTRPITSFCVGGLHACAVFDSKQMKCWGLKPSWGASNSFTDGLGDSIAELGDRMPYINVGKGEVIEKVFCGALHVCVKLDKGVMKCLGWNEYGQIGLGIKKFVVGAISGYTGDRLPAVKLGNRLQVLDISLGNFHSCALLTGNKVKCFGLNNEGQLGCGDNAIRGLYESSMNNNLPFIRFGTGVEVASIHSGHASYHNCIILSKPTPSAQRIKCWGFNAGSQLGYGDTNSRGRDLKEMGDNLSLVDLGTESKVKQLALGEVYTCALLINDEMKCFGSEINGALGSGSSSTVTSVGNSLPFVAIDSGKTIKFVSTGIDHTCIVYDDMISMKCVGNNEFGQLGQGDIENRGNSLETTFPNFTAIDLGKGSVNISSIHPGLQHNCVLFEDNTVKCFGYNIYGQLGIGSTNNIGDNIGDMGNNLTYVEFFSLLKPCDYKSAKMCKNDIKCMWKKVGNKKKCTEFDCNALKNGECEKQSTRCIWNNATSLCEEIK